MCTSTIALVCALLRTLAEVSAAQGAGFCLTPRAIDFGAVRAGETMTRTVLVSNRSLSPVRLGPVGSTCECLRSEVSTTELPPNGFGRWTIRLAPCAAKGEAYAAVSILVDGTPQSVPVRYESVGRVYADPPQVEFGLTTEDSATCVVRLRTTCSEPIELLGWESDNAEFSAEILNYVVSYESDAALRIWVTPRSSARSIRSTVRVFTSDAEAPVVEFHVRAFPVADIRMEPPIIDFGKIPFAEVRRASARISLPEAGQVVAVRTGTVAADVVRIDQHPDGATITLESQREHRLGQLSGSLIIEYRTGSGTTVAEARFVGQVVEFGGRVAASSQLRPSEVTN